MSSSSGKISTPKPLLFHIHRKTPYLFETMRVINGSQLCIHNSWNYMFIKMVFICFCFSFRESFWPGGILAEVAPERSENVKLRTLVAAKVKLFSSIPGRCDIKMILICSNFFFFYFFLSRVHDL